MDRPKINLPYEQIDILFEMLNITLLLLIWGYTFSNFFDLPDTIPTHFNGQGEPDAYGGKGTIFILPLIATALFFLMFILNRFPHMHNYLAEITRENALAYYRLSTRALRAINLYCLLLFAVLIYDIIAMANGGDATFMGLPLMLVSFIVPIIIVIYIVVQQKRINS
ncbi:MAG: DUF1648 domain-containing protein [Bacteroidia bacterium]|nr:DUF1648 domain-containing protein [Bacteroidia bacterium]